MLLQYEEIGKLLRHCEGYFNVMPGIFDVYGLEKSPDHTTFWTWDREFSMRELRSLLRHQRSRWAFRVPKQSVLAGSREIRPATTIASVLNSRFEAV